MLSYHLPLDSCLEDVVQVHLHEEAVLGFQVNYTIPAHKWQANVA